MSVCMAPCFTFLIINLKWCVQRRARNQLFYQGWMLSLIACNFFVCTLGGRLRWKFEISSHHRATNGANSSAPLRSQIGFHPTLFVGRKFAPPGREGSYPKPIPPHPTNSSTLPSLPPVTSVTCVSLFSSTSRRRPRLSRNGPTPPRGTTNQHQTAGWLSAATTRVVRERA